VDAKLGKELAKALRTSAPDGGLWTAPKVAAWITDKTGQEVHQTTGWRAMRRLGFSLQVPRPANKRRASLEEQAEFKKDKTFCASSSKGIPCGGSRSLEPRRSSLRSLDELEQKVCSRCQKISAAEVSARTNYDWWPEL
jgi:hypothetical protein